MDINWYYMCPINGEKINLAIEEKYAELAWDFTHRKKLRLANKSPQDLTETAIATFTKLYDLDGEESLKIINWVYYFQYSNEFNIDIKGE